MPCDSRSLSLDGAYAIRVEPLPFDQLCERNVERGSTTVCESGAGEYTDGESCGHVLHRVGEVVGDSIDFLLAQRAVEGSLSLLQLHGYHDCCGRAFIPIPWTQKTPWTR